MLAHRSLSSCAVVDGSPENGRETIYAKGSLCVSHATPIETNPCGRLKLMVLMFNVSTA